MRRESNFPGLRAITSHFPHRREAQIRRVSRNLVHEQCSSAFFPRGAHEGVPG